jgi:hypothetical protein
MADIFFNDTTGDIVLKDGDLYFTSDLNATESLRQRLTAYLRTFLGEWFLDSKATPTVGVPYWQSLFVDKIPSLELADTIFRNAILHVEGVATVNTLEFDFDRITRDMRVRFVCTSDAGDLVPGEVEVAI